MPGPTITGHRTAAIRAAWRHGAVRGVAVPLLVLPASSEESRHADHVYMAGIAIRRS